MLYMSQFSLCKNEERLTTCNTYGRTFLRGSLITIFLLLLLFTVGCGGGTRGTETGDRPVRFSGVVTDSQGVPLVGILVAINDSGSTLTDANGNFDLFADIGATGATQVQLALQGNSLNGIIPQLDAASVTATLVVQVDLIANSVDVSVITQATPTVAPVASPTALPTHMPVASPTAVALPTNTAQATATPTSTFTPIAPVPSHTPNGSNGLE
ncbi:MAG: hypothetical protein K1X79_11285 [Oligoflexia bacterium]|nr:hypothetical protein [Oligoflexia bacterium]